MAHTDPRENADDPQPDRDPFEGLGSDDLNLDLDLPELDNVDSEEVAEAPIVSAPQPSPAPPPHAEPAPNATVGGERPRGRRTSLWIAIAAALVLLLPLGWLGWAFMQDRSELDGIDSSLDSARNAAERTSDALEDGPERQQTQALASRIGAIDSAEWWDHVVVRIVAADDINRLKSEAGELTELLSRRSANRAWWRERMAKLDEELAANERTIAQLDAVKEELATPPLPHDGDGGVSQETIAATQGKIDAALAELVQTQAQAVAVFATAAQSSVAIDNFDGLTALDAAIDAETAIDRRPPELAQAKEAAQRAVAAARAVLEHRDAVLKDLADLQESANSLDLEVAESSEVQELESRLAAIAFDESDARFQSCAEPTTAAQFAIDQARTGIAARDAALLWVQGWLQRVNEAPDLESLLAALQQFEGETPPASELQVVQSASLDFAARVRSRTEELVIERAEREASIARKAACAVRLEAFASALESGDLSGAASELDSAVPETDEQTAEVDDLKMALAEVLRDWLAEGSTDGDAARKTADQLRACLTNKAVARMAPLFAAQAAEVWPRVLAMEDRFLYDALRQLVAAPATMFEPVALWYLDPTRTRGESPPMGAEIEAAIEAMKQPPVTLQVEGIEWSTVPCNWSRPQTDLMVAIGDEVRVYRLGPVAPESTSLLTMSDLFEKRFTLPRDTTLMLSIRGNFGCDDAQSRFRGSGEVTIDDLRAGGRFSLPFSSGGEDRTNPHKLIFVAFPDEGVRRKLQLPPWKSTGSTVNDQPAPTDEPRGNAPTGDAPTRDAPMGDEPMGDEPLRGA